MKNRYSFTLLVIMALSIISGAKMLYEGNLWGFVPLSIGGLMTMGFRELSPANPRKAGLITFFGTRTKTYVEGLTLLLDWLPLNIVGVVEFSMQKEDMDFNIESVRCGDGVRMTGKVSISVSPDPENLGDFDDTKQMPGIKSQLDEIVTSGVQEIAVADGHDYKWVESHSQDIAEDLRKRIRDNSNGSKNSDDSLGGTGGLGFVINKLQVKMKPINPDVIKAEEDFQVELLARRAEERDTETINIQAQKRLEAYRDWQRLPENAGKSIPTWAQCREQVVFERLAKDKKVTIIQGGRNVNLNTVGNTNPNTGGN